MLRRIKQDVAQDLPKKDEQVLFCKLTSVQRSAYEQFISSSEVSSILNGQRHVLSGIDILRKICNHPDLIDQKGAKVEDYGAIEKSGKV
jgi:DNA excision repair protein ERCC-6